jgi:hypothetical protein
LTGTWVATIQLEATIDDSTWFLLEIIGVSDGQPASSTATNGVWSVPCGGFSQVRAFSSAYTSGTVNVNLQANVGGPLYTNHTNLERLSGSFVDVAAGNAGAGTQRVVVATDNPSITVDAPTATPVAVQRRRLRLR